MNTKLLSIINKHKLSDKDIVHLMKRYDITERAVRSWRLGERSCGLIYTDTLTRILEG